MFVEVKERRGASHGTGVEAVTTGKRQRLLSAARVYASQHGLSDSPLRFDVVAIDWSGAQANVRHDRDAFGFSY